MNRYLVERIAGVGTPLVCGRGVEQSPRLGVLKLDGEMNVEMMMAVTV